MNAALRHFAMRFWLTAFAGGLSAIALLPWWQRFMGIHWLVFPGLLILAGWFVLAGRGLNRTGLWLLRRHFKEAAVWMRAGMAPEAETTYQKAMAVFDSFWLSPGARNRAAPRCTGALARYYLGGSSTNPQARDWVAGYLKQYPADEEVAETWLEQLTLYPDHLAIEHEAAAEVAHAHPDHPRVQQLLTQFYLSVGRMDFDARQTYRRAWKMEPLPDESVCRLARLLLEEAAVGPWALQVYLKAREAGEEGVLEGLAAAVRWLPPSPVNRADLAKARSLLEKIDASEREHLTRRFKPVAVATQPAVRRPKRNLPSFDARRWLGPVQTMICALGSGLGTLGSGIHLGPRFLRLVAAMVLLVGVGLGVRQFWRPAPEAPPEAIAVPEAPVVTDPFTIQVASYLRAEDAQRFVDQLSRQGLAAFRTKATSADRTWYQVKISHFATQSEAQSYGRELKSKGWIDDFYVANYPPVPAARP